MLPKVTVSRNSSPKNIPEPYSTSYMQGQYGGFPADLTTYDFFTSVNASTGHNVRIGGICPNPRVGATGINDEINWINVNGENKNK